MTKIHKPNLPQSGFKEYLKSNRRKMFRKHRADSCPVARYINTFLPKGLYVEVDIDVIDVYSTLASDRLRKGNLDRRMSPRSIAKFVTPKWAEKFVMSFDLLPGNKISGAKILDMVDI